MSPPTCASWFGRIADGDLDVDLGHVTAQDKSLRARSLP